MYQKSEPHSVDALSVAKQLNVLRKWIEGDGFATALADADLQTAKDVLSRLKHAKDKKAHVRSVINHLEGAESTLRRQLEASQDYLIIVRMLKVIKMEHKHAFIRAMLKACYIYVGEPTLAEQFSDKEYDSCNVSIYTRGDDISVTQFLMISGALFANIINPLLYYDLVKDSKMEEIYDIKKIPRIG